MNRLSKYFLTGFAILFGSEIVLRFFIGLGHPPLYILDRDFAYALKPSQHISRPKDFRVNAQSMRSDDISLDLLPTYKRKLMVIGDSVINGGRWIDQKDLATQILQERLPKPSLVMNVSAPGWGPQHQLAFLKRVGTFGADTVVFVYNPGDAFDARADENGRWSHPTETFPIALGELVVWFLRNFENTTGPKSLAPDSLKEMLRQSHDYVGFHGASRVYTFLTPYRREVGVSRNQRQEGSKILLKCFEELKIPVLDLNEASYGWNKALYVDEVHLNRQGQEFLADKILPVIMGVAPKY